MTSFRLENRTTNLKDDRSSRGGSDLLNHFQKIGLKSRGSPSSQRGEQSIYQNIPNS